MITEKEREKTKKKQRCVTKDSIVKWIRRLERLTKEGEEQEEQECYKI